jgi:hypothetical protein
MDTNSAVVNGRPRYVVARRHRRAAIINIEHQNHTYLIYPTIVLLSIPAILM